MDGCLTRVRAVAPICIPHHSRILDRGDRNFRNMTRRRLHPDRMGVGGRCTGSHPLRRVAETTDRADSPNFRSKPTPAMASASVRLGLVRRMSLRNLPPPGLQVPNHRLDTRSKVSCEPITVAPRRSPGARQCSRLPADEPMMRDMDDWKPSQQDTLPRYLGTTRSSSWWAA
jgi:hypothetical protein